MGVEGVDVLGTFEPVDDQVSERGGEDFVGDFEEVAFDNEDEELVRREGACEEDRDDQCRVDELADDG